MPAISKQSGGTPTAKTKVETRIMGGPKSAWDSQQFLRMILYGQSGRGKTTIWGSFPGRIFAIICSGGTQPGELKSIDTPENRKRITARIVDTNEQYGAALQEAVGYDTVVLDHGSGYTDILVKEALGVEEIPLVKYRKASKGESWSILSKQQWGQIVIQCKEGLRDLLKLQSNVVIVAQERIFKADDDGSGTSNSLSDVVAPTIGPGLSPSVVAWLYPICDYIVQAYIRPRTVEVDTGIEIEGKVQMLKERSEGVDYCLRTAPHDVYMTKFRLVKGTRILPECIVDPSYAKLMALINGK